MKKYGELPMVGGLLMIGIAILIAAALIPTVANTVAASTNNSNVYSLGQNVTGGANTLLAISTLLFVAIVILVVYRATIG